MATRATRGLGAAAAAVLALGACSSEDPIPSGAAGGQAGTSTPPAGSATVGGGGSSAGVTSQPSAGTVSASGTSTGGSASGGGTAGSGSNGATAGANNTGSAGSATGGAGGGAGSASATAPKPSVGCNQAASGALNQWVDSMVMTSGADRPYSVRLPSGYDQTRAYPVVVLLHGCSSGTNNVPMEKVTGPDAILVRGTGSAANTCWETRATGPDVAFFDAMVADVKARFCADERRVFIVGYSSGSWLVNQLTCIRGDVVRGGASVSGGESSNGKCGGPVARLFLHDSTDTDNLISGSEKARDRQLTQNTCEKAAPATPVDPSPCTQYQGCAAGNPVQWCQTSGKAHGRQDDFAPAAFWNFFKSL